MGCLQSKTKFKLKTGSDDRNAEETGCPGTVNNSHSFHDISELDAGIVKNMSKNVNNQTEALNRNTNMDTSTADTHSHACKSKLKIYGLFPKWKGYKMCNLCETEFSKNLGHTKERDSSPKKTDNIPGAKKKPLCKKCSVALGLNGNNTNTSNNMRVPNICSVKGLLTSTTLANILAMVSGTVSWYFFLAVSSFPGSSICL